jgi:hypothetical protein
MQIIIQKQYIVLAEVAENIFAVFLVIVNFVFHVVINVVQKVKDSVDEIVKYVKNIFSKFEQVVLGLNNNFNYKRVAVKSDFIIYSNLLAPPARL